MPTLDSMRGDLAYSSRIAAATLAVLAESGDLAARTRALRALGTQGAVVQGKGYWIRPAELTAMLKTAEIDARLARRIGRTLVRLDAVGLALCYGGLATAEKAYRRVHHLLARESQESEYEPRQIDGERGRIRFHLVSEPGMGDRFGDDVGPLLCSVRQGMLEAIPMLFGLVPATVREKRCSYKGAPHCEFEIKWSRGPRTGLAIGGGAGLAMGAGVLLGSAAMGWPMWAAAVAAPALAILTGAAGRSIDLTRQLEAVAGARRGHLALLDQLDDALAERMDTLAKHGAIPSTHSEAGVAGPRDESSEGLVPVHRRPSPSVPAPDVDESHEQTRRVKDLRALVERATDRVRAESPPSVRIDLDLGDEAAPVRCDPEQIAYVVEQLVRNAVEATPASANREDVTDRNARAGVDDGASETDARRAAHAAHDARSDGSGDAHGPNAVAPGVWVRVREAQGGVELSVEDAGEGIDPDLVERVFDPFDEAGPAGRVGGLGLPVCLRIVQGHGGEMRVQAGGEHGTRVSVVLPQADPV